MTSPQVRNTRKILDGRMRVLGGSELFSNAHKWIPRGSQNFAYNICESEFLVSLLSWKPV